MWIILESVEVFDRCASICSLFTEWHKIGTGLGSGSASRVYGAPRHAAHRSDVAQQPAVLSVPDGHRRRADVHSQADTAESTGTSGIAVRDSGRQQAISGSGGSGVSHRGADHGYTSSTRETAKGWSSPAFR